jgi:hypothetical protein
MGMQVQEPSADQIAAAKSEPFALWKILVIVAGGVAMLGACVAFWCIRLRASKRTGMRLGSYLFCFLSQILVKLCQLPVLIYTEMYKVHSLPFLLLTIPLPLLASHTHYLYPSCFPSCFPSLPPALSLCSSICLPLCLASHTFFERHVHRHASEYACITPKGCEH